MFWNYDYVHVKVRIHGEKLHVMPKLHRLSTPDIVARYIAVVEFSPAFATFRVFTIAYLPSQLRKFQCSANQFSLSHKSHGWLKCHSSHVSRKLKSSFRQAQKETHIRLSSFLINGETNETRRFKYSSFIPTYSLYELRDLLWPTLAQFCGLPTSPAFWPSSLGPKHGDFSFLCDLSPRHLRAFSD